MLPAASWMRPTVYWMYALPGVRNEPFTASFTAALALLGSLSSIAAPRTANPSPWFGSMVVAFLASISASAPRPASTSARALATCVL